MRTCVDHSFVQSGTGPLPMESSTPHPPETTRDDVPGPSGEWSAFMHVYMSVCACIAVLYDRYLTDFTKSYIWSPLAKM